MSVTVDSFGILGGVAPDVLKAEEDFAATVVDPKVNAEFAFHKGSSPVRIDVPTEQLDACNNLVLDNLKKPNFSVENPFYISDTDWINSVWNVMYTAQGDPNMSDDAYRTMVATFKEHIFAGDIFQGVPSRRVSFPAPEGGYPIYRRLRVSNPAPYMFYVRMLGMELAGSSPEPLVRVEGRQVSTRPVAGTRPRGQTEVRDRMLEHELLADPKEQAEHAMLVDLARNDLGRVCTPGSVKPTQLMEVERFTKVMHIVSTVEGELREEFHPLDALAVTFPAGTLTGAPKRRAMELIAASEPTARGPYGGAVGYVTFEGDLDFCITIRTAVVAKGRATVQTGAGVVADSDPATELEETKAKAAALLPAVAPTGGGTTR